MRALRPPTGDVPTAPQDAQDRTASFHSGTTTDAISAKSSFPVGEQPFVEVLKAAVIHKKANLRAHLTPPMYQGCSGSIIFSFFKWLDTRNVYQAFYLAFVPQAAEPDYPIDEVNLDGDLNALVGATMMSKQSTRGGARLG